VPGVSLNSDGSVASYDFALQCRTVFDNVRTVIEDAGASWDDIVDVTVFLTNIRRDFQTYNALYAEYFAANRPTRTTVEVSRLPTPIAIELKVIAWLGED
jgi:2-aminomuconate deaminase